MESSLTVDPAGQVDDPRLDVSTEQGCDLNERQRSLTSVSVHSRVNDTHRLRATPTEKHPIQICTPHLAGLSLGSGEIYMWVTRQKWIRAAMEGCLVPVLGIIGAIILIAIFRAIDTT
jgi:hypothetical protein